MGILTFSYTLVSQQGQAIYYHVRYFQPFGFTSRIQQLSSKLRSTPFNYGATLAPKLTDPLGRLHPSLFWIRYSWSGSTIILYYIYLSVRWNKLLRNQISLCQHVFYYIMLKQWVYGWWLNGEVSSVNITLGGTRYPGQKLACFVLQKTKTNNVNKTHQHIPGISTVILGVMEPNLSIINWVLSKNSSTPNIPGLIKAKQIISFTDKGTHKKKINQMTLICGHCMYPVSLVIFIWWPWKHYLQ